MVIAAEVVNDHKKKKNYTAIVHVFYRQFANINHYIILTHIKHHVLSISNLKTYNFGSTYIQQIGNCII